MTELMQASRQWASRPQDERYASLLDMQSFMHSLKSRSRSIVESTRSIQAISDPSDPRHKGLFLGIDKGSLAGTQLAPTHYAFGQLCSLASPSNSPAAYFRQSGLPAEIIADALNANFITRKVDEIGLLGTLVESRDQRYDDRGVFTGDGGMRAATGPNYGRIWNADVTDALVESFGDGVSGHWRVPGEFGQRVTVDKANTTLYASDRDMFVFLADEDRRIDVPNRRNGGAGSMARGIFAWNSEVGDATLGLGFFLFDYVCCNRIVWGADQYTEVRIRHTKGAPDRWLEEVMPVIKEYDEGSALPVQKAIAAAQERRVQDDLDAFLAKRFASKKIVEPIKAIHLVEEGRPIETLWDVVTAATAHARSLPHTDDRLVIEREAGKILSEAAA
jgi:hypothetical protein